MQKSLFSERNQFFLQMLRDARIGAGLSQTQLAHALSIDQTLVSKAETGIRRLDVVELHAWLEALELSLFDFVKALDEGLSAIAVRNRLPPRKRR